MPHYRLKGRAGWGNLPAWRENSPCNIRKERRESAEDNAARLVAAGLKEAGWKEFDLALRREGERERGVNP